MISGAVLVATYSPPPHLKSTKAWHTPTWQCGTPLADVSTAQVSEHYSDFKSSFLEQVSDDKCCIKRPDQSNDCVSEGVGYAMLMSAYLSDEPTFRCMWTFA